MSSFRKNRMTYPLKMAFPRYILGGPTFRLPLFMILFWRTFEPFQHYRSLIIIIIMAGMAVF